MSEPPPTTPPRRRQPPQRLLLAVSPAELATLLAALRHWQTDLTLSHGAVAHSYPHFAEVEPLAWAAIDALCERLNLSSFFPPGA